MAKQLVFRARIVSQQKFNAGIFSFDLWGIRFSIIHAHDNQWRVCVPGNVEIFRIVKRGNTCAVLEV